VGNISKEKQQLQIKVSIAHSIVLLGTYFILALILRIIKISTR
jgi:hypothetical protein